MTLIAWGIYLPWLSLNISDYFQITFHHFSLERFQCWTCIQGGTEVRWRPGQETSLVPPRSNLRSLGSKNTVLKKVLASLLWLIGAPQWLNAPIWIRLGAGGAVTPLIPSLRPCLWLRNINSDSADILSNIGGMYASSINFVHWCLSAESFDRK